MVHAFRFQSLYAQCTQTNALSNMTTDDTDVTDFH
jgi:hypothetical protein